MAEDRFLRDQSTHTEGIQETIKELHEVVESSQDTLMSVSTVFPLDLFPDRITVDRTQVTITHRRFFFMGNVISIRLEDILSVSSNTGPFFGSIRISTRYYHSDREYHVNWLWRSQALHLKCIIQGLVVARSKGIDVTNIDRVVLIREIMKLGESSISEAP